MPAPAQSEDTPRHSEIERVEISVVDWLRTELDDPEITAADNFLDIGGHSLTFARLNAHLAEAFGLNLDMRVAYEEPLSIAVGRAQPAEPRA
jgi:acyl carrier protein